MTHPKPPTPHTHHRKFIKCHAHYRATWETDMYDYRAVSIPGAGVFAEVTGNTHQAMWMATREQVRLGGVLLFGMGCGGFGVSRRVVTVDRSVGPIR